MPSSATTKKRPIGPRQRDKLLAAARQARSNAYCPYTHYAVGAAILGESGRVYTGCNVESPTAIGHICAERNAIYHAISQGEKRLAAVAVVSKASVPCGSCRQIILEFGAAETPIFSLCLEDGKEKLFETTIGRLLPHAHTSEVF